MQSLQSVCHRMVRRWALIGFAAMVMTACVAPPSAPPPPTTPPTPSPTPVAPPERVPVPPPTPTVTETDRLAYRLEAGRHIYKIHEHKVHPTRLAPLLKGVGVIEITINPKGQLTRMQWIRAPKHVPQVVKAIEDLIESAQPFPIPAVGTEVTFMETWLWNRNDRFQLDSLSLGQD